MQPSTVIIFDWDDTICPSTFIDQCKVQSLNDLPLHFQNLLQDIGRAAEQCLLAASQHGEVIIITNSDDGWVHYSCKRYIPNLLPYLEKVRIVSARTEYEEFYPDAPLCWKAAAFAHEVNEIFEEMEERVMTMQQALVFDKESYNQRMELSPSPYVHGHNPMIRTQGTDMSTSAFESLNSTDDSSSSDDSRDERKGRLLKQKKKSSSHQDTISREIISFGDSMEERTAVKIVSNQLTALPKSVMFISSPTPEQLIGQLCMLEMHMKYICTHTSALDLEISPQQAEKCAMSVLNGENRLRRNVTYSQIADGMPQRIPRMRRASMKGNEETFSL
mmetsp:Transcript_3292/g.6164  ORF Transcript_3292/g.6164 Transcript_3292/m.6164 type:complete len:332 (+) Transcript_3292:313-1308(+)|eukprot:CAMPEP_0176490620 /NCGR_PEP_ID=MMETSP0200_2-20121128/7971_1 /TAXON_ID=947934 /ORGANISM="Chaetoceros sp., Strain GSL56" /LENGTH=331 /DNA_ID=CAMNT_0017887945 /DNA_START=230 /DNA_END=1225 /DNA_ORIENTATION=+